MPAANALRRQKRQIETRFWKKLARGSGKPRRGKMNALEAAYAEHLAARELRGEILWWAFEGIALRLAQDSVGDEQATKGRGHSAIVYTPDFAVELADGTIEFHETKGHWREAARVRIKVAASTYPFRFYGVRSVQGRWVFEPFSCAHAEGVPDSS